MSRGMKRGFIGAAILSVLLIIIGLITAYFGSRYQLRLVYSAYVNLLVEMVMCPDKYPQFF